MTELISGKKEEKKDDELFHYMDNDGRLHVVDLVSGKIVKSAPEFEKGLIAGQNMSPQFIKGMSSFWNYSPVYKDLIAQRIAEGQTLTAIGKTAGFPSTAIIAKWRAQHPDFNEAVIIARKARAEHYADKIAEGLEETKELNKEEIPAEKLYFDKLKYLAEKNDPGTYGTKKTEEGGGATPINMTINTGVPLSEEEAPIIIEVKE